MCQAQVLCWPNLPAIEWLLPFSHGTIYWHTLLGNINKLQKYEIHTPPQHFNKLALLHHNHMVFNNLGSCRTPSSNMCDAHMTLWTLDRHRHNYWNSSSGNGFEAWEGARPREKSMADSWEKLFVSSLLCTSSLATKHAGTGLNGRWIQLPNCTNFYSCSCFDISCLLSSFEDVRSVIYFILLRFVLPCPTHHIIHVTSPSSFSFP